MMMNLFGNVSTIYEERVDELPIHHLSKSNRIISSDSGSGGNQIKWMYNNVFYKLDLLGYESIAEKLTTILLQHSDFKKDEYVEYYRCRIVEDGIPLGIGCYCYNMLAPGELEISINQILNVWGLSASIKFDELRELLFDILGIDVKIYLGRILQLDTITLNEDRHFKNISLIRNKQGYKLGKIFDNGAAFLSDKIMYPMSVNWQQMIPLVQAKPFNSNFLKQVPEFMDPIGIKYDDLFSSVSVHSPEFIRAVEILKYRLTELEGIVWKRL